MNPVLDKLQVSITLRVADKARELERSGIKIIKLQTGDSDFSTPGPIVEACNRAILDGYTHYAATRGLIELRKAVSGSIKNLYGLEYDPDSEILITHGGVHAVFCTIQSVIAPGEEVIIIDPSWAPYESSTWIANGIPRRIPSDGKTGFRPPIELIAESINDKTRLLIINSPNNPTGTVYTIDELQQLSDLAVKNDLLVISDEVYSRLIFDDAKHISIASLPGMKERTITINSFSKTYAMAGWRLGYVTAPPEILSAILKVSQYSITNVAPFIQMAGLTALTNQRSEKSVLEMVSAYNKRRGWILSELNEMNGIGYSIPQGAFYFMLDISEYNPDSADFCEKLLSEKHVATIPGAGFGDCSEGFIRITFAAPEQTIEEGLRRIREFIS